MSTTREIQPISAAEAAVVMEPDDPSVAEIKFLTDQGWYRFQLPRMELIHLGRELQEGLQTTAEDQPRG